MRVLLDAKTFRYFSRISDDLANLSADTLRLKLGNGGPMTRKCVVAELARREGAKVVRRR